MKALIVSDTHGKYKFLQKVLERVGKLDLLIHCGDLEGGEEYLKSLVDCPVEMVSGNNDYFTSLPRERMFQIGEYHIFLTHGHRYRVNYGIDLIKQTGKERGANIVMFGHTHKPFLRQEKDMIILNPGSISQPRQEGQIPSYIIMEFDRRGEVHFTVNYIK